MRHFSRPLQTSIRLQTNQAGCYLNTIKCAKWHTEPNVKPKKCANWRPVPLYRIILWRFLECLSSPLIGVAHFTVKKIKSWNQFENSGRGIFPMSHLEMGGSLWLTTTRLLHHVTTTCATSKTVLPVNQKSGSCNKQILIHFCLNSCKFVLCLTPTLSGLSILNDGSLIVQNRLVSSLF